MDQVSENRIEIALRAGVKDTEVEPERMGRGQRLARLRLDRLRWDDNDSLSLLALREGAKFGDDQPLDLVLGLWDFFHNTYDHYGGGRRTDTGVASIIP
jgi:hypothetical protein